MKNKRMLKILGITVVLSVLLALLPAAAVLGAEDFTLSPNQGMIGATITIEGTDFTPSTDASEKMARVYISPTSATVGQNLDINVTTYEKVGDYSIGFSGDSDEGEFSGTFTVPSVCNDGAVAGTITPGTYYIYVTVPTTTVPNPTLIKAKETFTVTQGATLDPLSPASGAAGTAVVVSGYNFPVSTALVFKIDTTTITPTSGDTATRTSGVFITTITVPTGTTAGAHTITVTAGVGTATATFTVSASPTLGAPSPASGPAGTSVTISGTAFPANSALTFTIDTTIALTPSAGSLETSSAGTFTTIIVIPADAAVGAHTITVTAGITALATTFTVTSTATTTPPATTPPTTTPPATTTPPTDNVTPPSGNPNTSIKIPSPPDAVGAAVNMIGMDFTPGATVTFTYDAVAMATAVADADGFVTGSFNVPVSEHGSHTIMATDGVNYDTVDIIIESVAPTSPSPLKPGMGAKVKSPALFDWGDVTDPSVPVTYELQIATDDDFATDALVIYKTGLTTSEYTLTDEELAKLDDPQASYYWRERALDGASNPSLWTGAGKFTVTQPFRFVGWPLYVTIGVGAVLIFLLGLWVGRRTAFYY